MRADAAPRTSLADRLLDLIGVEWKTVPADLAPEFKGELARKEAEATWIILIIAIVLFPPTTILDAISYPSLYDILSRIRFSTSAVLSLLAIGMYAARSRGTDVRLRHLFVFLWTAICSGGIQLMVMVAGGGDTPYYNGVTMVLLTLMVSMPWSIGRMGAVAAAIIIQADLFLLWTDRQIDPAGYYNANYFWIAMSLIGMFWNILGHQLRVRDFLQRKQIEVEKAKSEKLLLNILPDEIAEELKLNNKVQARNIQSCTILFTDFVGFTKLSGAVPPDKLVASLDKAFSRFDGIVTGHGLEKLKTIGDAYMCAGGVIGEQPDHLVRCLLAGLEMLKALEDVDVRAADGNAWRMRVGVHPGPVVAGVIGQKKFAYDLWGDTVNTAARLESSSQPRCVNVMTSTYRRVQCFFQGVDRGLVPVRGKGPIAMTRIVRLWPRYSADEAGYVANDQLYEDLNDWLAEDMTDAPSHVQELHDDEAVVEMPAEGMEAIRVFPELNLDDREVLVKLTDSVAFQPGQVVIEQGQTLKVMYLIIKGLMAVRLAREGVSIEVALLHPGDIVGELSFVSWEPASATVVALEEVTALRFDLDKLERLMEDHPHTGIRLFHSLALVLAQRLREANARLFAWDAQARAGQAGSLARGAIATDDVPDELGATIREVERTLLDLDDDIETPTHELLALVTRELDGLFSSVARHAETSDDDPRRFDAGIGAFVLREAYPVLMRSALIERMVAQPLGNTYDHVVAEMFNDTKPQGHGRLGRLVDRWFRRWELAQALRATVEATLAQVVTLRGAHRADDAIYRLTVIAAGVAPALVDMVESMAPVERLSITCMDGNLGALASLGRRAVDAALSERFTFLCEATFDVSQMSRTVRLMPQQLMVLPLLAEVTNEEHMVRLLDMAHSNLAQGGALVIGVPLLSEVAAFLVEAILDWPIDGQSPDWIMSCAHNSMFHGEPIEVDARPEEGYAVVTLRRSFG